MTDRSLLVVGAGIIGLTTAVFAQRQGWTVTVVSDPNTAPATLAAAGMIAPFGELTPGENRAFSEQSASLSIWKRILPELTGQPVVNCGTLFIGWALSDRAEIAQLEKVASHFGALHRIVSRHVEKDLFAQITPRVHEGLFGPEDGSVDPRMVMQHLQRLFSNNGGHFISGIPIQRTSCHGVAVTVDGVEITAQFGVWSTGASPPPFVNDFPAGVNVRPIRGTTMVLGSEMPENSPMIRAFVQGRQLYALRRSPSEVIVGATSRESSQKGVDVGEMGMLLRDLSAVIPVLDSADVLEIRHGLRPATTDNNPILQWHPTEPWIWSGGHYRHGVTLAPLYAERAVNLLNERNSC
jgi:glycine oxidase